MQYTSIHTQVGRCVFASVKRNKCLKNKYFCKSSLLWVLEISRKLKVLEQLAKICQQYHQ